jgi:hypothetical protein
MRAPFWHSISRRKRKLAVWTAVLLLAYAVVGFLILPPVIRSVAAKQLSRQLNREVSIEKVKINPFVLSCTVRGLLIKDADGQPFVSWDEVYVNFQLSSFLGHAWVFKEISTSRPFVRVQMNQDRTFNFSDILAKFATNAPAAAPGTPARPLILHVQRLHIGGATAALADFTTREPFKRTLGPLDITLDDFRTDPDNKNPYSFRGTTDAGEQISWSGVFSLTPLRSHGELTLFNFTLNKYAPLYQDLVRFEIRGGSIALDAKYHFEMSPTNLAAAVDDAAFALRDFKLGAPGDSNNIVSLALLDVTGARADLESHNAAVGSVKVDGARLFVSRSRDNSVNVIDLAKPSDPAANAPGGIVFLLRSVTNAVAMLLNSTNQWSGTIGSVAVTNCALHLEDDVNSRPAWLDLSDITLDAKNISNLPGMNLTAALSLRWNTNGSIRAVTTASFLPQTADIQLDLDRLDLGTLDPYLEPKLNLYILGSKVGLHGKISLRAPPGGLPQVTFRGDASLDDFHTVDGVMAEDLVKWDSIGFNGIDANLNPQTVSIREIDVNNAYARLIIETNKTINLLNALRMTNTNAPATNETQVAAAPAIPATNAPLPQISIGAIVITNTAVSFTDRSLQPNVNLTVQSVNGSIAGLSTEQLQHADIALNAMIDGVGPANITGTINPFSGTQTNIIRVSVKDMDLTSASPYSGKFAGYRIAEGKLNLDLPVRLAIAILKDRDGKIVLDVPIEGSIDDPKLRIGKVVQRAIVNILEKVATSPFSLLGALFGGGGEELRWQDFTAGSADLTAPDKQKLDSLVKGLFARPALQLEISGSVDPDGDREGLERAALDKEIRTRIWMKLRKAEQATNSVDQIVLTADDRARYVPKIYAEAEAAGKITPQLIAANTNLAAYAAKVLPHKLAVTKQATLLIHSEMGAPKKQSAGAAFQTKLVPPPDPMEAVLLATYPVSQDDLETLATSRAAAVRACILQTGKVEASRLFLKQGESGGLRSDGSRVYLQFR